MSEWTLQRLLDETKVKGKLHPRPLSEFEDATRELGIAAFPPSYVELVSHFGAGVWKPGLMLFVPNDSVNHVCLMDEHKWYHEHLVMLNEAEHVYPPGLDLDGSPDPHPELERLKSFVCFGSIDTGEFLCWDIRRARPDGEMPIVSVYHEDDNIVECCDTAIQLIGDLWTDGKGPEYFEEDQTPNPPVFKPFKPRKKKQR